MKIISGSSAMQGRDIEAPYSRRWIYWEWRHVKHKHVRVHFLVANCHWSANCKLTNKEIVECHREGPQRSACDVCQMQTQVLEISSYNMDEVCRGLSQPLQAYLETEFVNTLRNFVSASNVNNNICWYILFK